VDRLRNEVDAHVYAALPQLRAQLRERARAPFRLHAPLDLRQLRLVLFVQLPLALREQVLLLLLLLRP
jgi:hypothetical protein